MIERERDIGGFVVNCDECPETVDVPDEDDWHAMLETIKEHGWRTFADSESEWAHACPACVERWAEENRDG